MSDGVLAGNSGYLSVLLNDFNGLVKDSKGSDDKSFRNDTLFNQHIQQTISDIDDTLVSHLRTGNAPGIDARGQDALQNVKTILLTQSNASNDPKGGNVGTVDVAAKNILIAFGADPNTFSDKPITTANAGSTTSGSTTPTATPSSTASDSATPTATQVTTADTTQTSYDDVDKLLAQSSGASSSSSKADYLHQGIQALVAHIDGGTSGVTTANVDTVSSASVGQAAGDFKNALVPVLKAFDNTAAAVSGSSIPDASKSAVLDLINKNVQGVEQLAQILPSVIQQSQSADQSNADPALATINSQINATLAQSVSTILTALDQLTTVLQALPDSAAKTSALDGINAAVKSLEPVVVDVSHTSSSVSNAVTSKST